MIPVALEIQRIDDDEFALFQKLVAAETGIQLGENKKSLLVGRLMRRLRELGCSSFAAYFERVETEEEEKGVLLDLVSTNETRFFRESNQFAFLEQNVYPVWQAQGRGRIRVWSAGCSTGEEAFSIAMSLLSHFPDGAIDILATDLSRRALAAATSATWPISRAADIPDHYLKAFMLRGVGSNNGFLQATPELRSLVSFAHFNLHTGDYSSIGTFDLLFCRNVLIYFSAESKGPVVQKLLAHTAEDGFFLLGQAETLNGITRDAFYAGNSIYTRNPSNASRPTLTSN